MKTFFYLSLLLGLVAVTLASVSVGNFSDPKHPGKCVLKSDLVLSPGKHKNPSVDCGALLCSSDGTVQFQSCGVKSVAVPGCTLGGYADVSLNYPECCQQKLVCPNNPDFDGKLV